METVSNKVTSNSVPQVFPIQSGSTYSWQCIHQRVVHSTLHYSFKKRRIVKERELELQANIFEKKRTTRRDLPIVNGGLMVVLLFCADYRRNQVQKSPHLL